MPWQDTAEDCNPQKHCSITAVAVTVFFFIAAQRRASIDMGFTDLMYAVELERPLWPIFRVSTSGVAHAFGSFSIIFSCPITHVPLDPDVPPVPPSQFLAVLQPLLRFECCFVIRKTLRSVTTSASIAHVAQLPCPQIFVCCSSGPYHAW